MTVKHGKPEVKLHEFSAHHVKVAREIVDEVYTTSQYDHARQLFRDTADMRVDTSGIVLKTDDGKGVWVPVDVFVSWEAIDTHPADPRVNYGGREYVIDITGVHYAPKGWDKVETSNEDDYARWQRAVATGATELGFNTWKRSNP